MTFSVIVLGCLGGPRENNLSGYLLRANGSPYFIALDAGTLLSGIAAAAAGGAFASFGLKIDPELSFPEAIFRNHIKGYLISHAHLDHMAGLIINSQVDVPKSLLGTDPTIDNIRDHLFNWKIWPNYGSEGVNPQKFYNYVRMPFYEQTQVVGTPFTVTPFPLSHHGTPSTAFLVGSGGEYVLYFGDTGSDKKEKTRHLDKIWEVAAPLIVHNKLRAIFIECSYPKYPLREHLYGHFNSEELMEELKKLALKVDPKQYQLALSKLKVIITHIKVGLKSGPDVRTRIQLEINELNNLNVQFIYPVQGMRIDL